MMSVKHILLDCADFIDTCHKHFTAEIMKRLFRDVSPDVIFFLKDLNVFHLIQIFKGKFKKKKALSSVLEPDLNVIFVQMKRFRECGRAIFNLVSSLALAWSGQLGSKHNLTSKL